MKGDRMAPLTTKQLGRTGMDKRNRKRSKGGSGNIVEKDAKGRLMVSGQIREAFKKSRWSIQELCDATVQDADDPASGLPYQTVWRWVAKDRVPSARTLDCIAMALGLKVVWK